MVPYFKLSHTVQGYGYLDEIGALYGLMWNTPKLLVASVLRSIGHDRDPLSIYVLREGFEKIWETIVIKENLDVKYNSDIVGIRRHDGAVGILLYQDFSLRLEFCDWLVWSAPMEEFIRVVADYDEDKYDMFRNSSSSVITSSLIKIVSDIRNGPVDAFLENLDNKVDHGVMASGFYEGLLTPGIRDPHVMNEWDASNNEAKLKTVLQMGRQYSNELDLNNILRDHFMNHFNASSVEILQTKSFKYFPRWTPEDVNCGLHWDVFDRQGRKNTWLTGSSVSFESVLSVLEYNNLLIRQWK